jgi:hypothetical protein
MGGIHNGLFRLIAFRRGASGWRLIAAMKLGAQTVEAVIAPPVGD